MTSIPPPKPKSTRKRKRWLLVCAILSILMIGVGIPLVLTETPFWGGVVSLLGIFIGSVTIALALSNKKIDNPNDNMCGGIMSGFENELKVITIGRTADNDYVINDDSSVNRHHCIIIIVQSGKCYIVDLNSMYGTFVNGVRVNKSVPINRYDKIQIGHTMLDIINIVPNTYLMAD